MGSVEKSNNIMATEERKKNKTIFVFDVDGTLTVPRQSITPQMLEFMKNLREQVPVAVVGGSDMNKIIEQLGPLKDICMSYTYVFSQNGLVGYCGLDKLPGESMRDVIGRDRMHKLIDFCLEYMSKLKLPTKTGNFIEYRESMLNVAPPGRNCSVAERLEFNDFDAVHHIRRTFIEALKKDFGDCGLNFAIGGQISFDVFPIGWDKTYCLRYLKDYDNIHFFGDKTMQGGNDYEIFSHPDVIGHTVVNPEDTVEQVNKVLSEL